MKIALLSDIHYGNHAKQGGDGPFLEEDHRLFASEIHAHKPDVVVATGDVAETVFGKWNLGEFLDIYKNPHGDSLFVTGNHDVWTRLEMMTDKGEEFVRVGEFADSEEKYLWHGTVAKEKGWTFLKDKPWIKDGIYIVGNMGWYDFSAAPIEFGQTPAIYERQRTWKEYHVMDLNFSKMFPMLDFCALRMAELETSLAHVPKDRKGLIVVTHFVGFPQLMGPRRDHNTAFFGNYEMGKMIRQAKPDLYYCGHTHSYAECNIDGIRCINNGSKYGRGSKRYDIVEV